MALGRIPQQYYITGWLQGALAAPCSCCQPWAGLLPPCYICSQHFPGLLSLPLELMVPEPNCTSLSQTPPCSVSVVPGAREVTAPSPSNKYCSPQILALVGSGVWGPTRAEGTETYLGTEVWALWRLLLREDMLNYSKRLPAQICTARVLGWAAVAAAALLTQSRLPTPKCPVGGQAIAHSCTHPAHSSTCTLKYALLLTFSWIFELIALWFSCKTNLGLGASGWSFQLLCTHLGFFPFFCSEIHCYT